MTRKFSIVMAFRDTPRERKFAQRSIPSAIALRPDEFLIGVDAPTDESFLRIIHDLCSRHSFTNYRILEVERSPEWRFQLANTIWHCYKACRNEKVLAFDVDSVLRPAVLQGYDLVGEGRAVVSFTKRLLIRSLTDLIRYGSYRLRVRRDSNVFSGVYWIYRPHYFADVDLDGMRSIQNGIDVYMVKRIVEIGRHEVVTLKEIGVSCMDMQNEDYPWRQFQSGIWYYANKERMREVRTKPTATTGILYRFIKFVVHSHPAVLMLVKSAMYWHPWFALGWLWARNHPDHKSVKKAREVTLYEWGTLGSKYVREIRDWSRYGRTGTGFA